MIGQQFEPSTNQITRKNRFENGYSFPPKTKGAPKRKQNIGGFR